MTDHITIHERFSLTERRALLRVLIWMARRDGADPCEGCVGALSC